MGTENRVGAGEEILQVGVTGVEPVLAHVFILQHVESCSFHPAFLHSLGQVFGLDYRPARGVDEVEITAELLDKVLTTM